jgi:IPT/TIG domain
MTDGLQPIPDEVLHKKVFFPRQHGPHDYFKMRGKAMRYLMLGTILVGQLTLGLWFKQERLPGAQRQYTYVEKIEKGKKQLEILAVNVYFTATGSYGRDAYLPGWPGTSNTVDCIGGGGGGGISNGIRGGGAGGGGGLARYNNVGALAATFGLSVGGGGGQNAAGGNTQLDGWVGAYGGGGGANGPGAGGAGGTYYAGQGYFTGGTGGYDAAGWLSGGGGGGAAGRYGGGGNGSNAINAASTPGGSGGPSGGGAPGANGNEWATNVGSGGGGAGQTYAAGLAGGYYGSGGGGGGYAGGAYAPGVGRQGLIAIVYTPYTTPVVSSISPNSGPTGGGQAVTISGSGFYNVTSANIGGAPLTGISVPHQGAITGTTSAGAAGTYNVNVNVSGGVAAGAGANLYTYGTPPSVSSCSPAVGVTLGGTPVTITGANFANVSSVTFGGTAATSVVLVNATTVTCIAPAHAEGLVNVVVVNNLGGTAGVNAFRYVLPSAGFNMPMLGF